MELNKLDLIQMDEKNYKNKKNTTTATVQRKTHQPTKQPPTRSFACSLARSFTSLLLMQQKLTTRK